MLPLSHYPHNTFITMYHTYGNAWGLSPLGFLGIGLIGGLIFIIVFVLKGYALWHAARRSEKWWLIALLVLNTMGILELIYLIAVVGKWHNFKDNGTPPASPTPTPQG